MHRHRDPAAQSGKQPAGPPVRPFVVLVGLLALALNLRAALAGYPAVLETAREQLEISAGGAGLVQTGAVLMMAVGSLAGSPVRRRFGQERALGAVVGLVAVGSVVRGVPTMAGLIVGSLLVGWSLSLAAWAVPAALAAAAWVPIARRTARTTRTSGRSVLPWRDGFARLTAGYLAGASLLVYGWMTWLSPYYESLGWAPRDAGLLLAAWGVAQIPAALFVPAPAERWRRWRLCAGLAGVQRGRNDRRPAAAEPTAARGMAVGRADQARRQRRIPAGSVGDRLAHPDAATSAATSGLAMTVGYTVAGLGPLLMGLLTT